MTVKILNFTITIIFQINAVYAFYLLINESSKKSKKSVLKNMKQLNCFQH